MASVEERTIDIVAEQLGVSKDQITRETSFVNDLGADSLDEAVHAASANARPGDVVVFSPACSSFDMFRSFEERGEAFREAVMGLSA